MKKKSSSGITLVSLVVTIIILLIIVGITINLTIGENGIITKAQEAVKKQKIASIKEQIGLELLEADTEAKLRGEILEQAQKEDIASKYGELQEDKDTLKLKDVDANVSLKEIWNGEIATTGSYTANVERIEELEKQVEQLEKALEDSSKTEGEKSQELTNLKTELAKITVTADKMLKGYTAFRLDKGIITGIIENNGEISGTLNAGESYTVPEGVTSGGTITANSLTSQTQATATADNITAGKTAWVNGELITGNGSDNQTYYNNGYSESDMVYTKTYVKGFNTGGGNASSTIDVTWSGYTPIGLNSIYFYYYDGSNGAPAGTLSLSGNQVTYTHNQNGSSSVGKIVTFNVIYIKK